jgi:hypothetical protein
VPILADHVEGYLKQLRPDRSEVMAEMEALAEREHVPPVGDGIGVAARRRT